MNESVITWSAPNFLTILAMLIVAAVGFGVVLKCASKLAHNRDA